MDFLIRTAGCCYSPLLLRTRRYCSVEFTVECKFDGEEIRRCCPVLAAITPLRVDGAVVVDAV